MRNPSPRAACAAEAAIGLEPQQLGDPACDPALVRLDHDALTQREPAPPASQRGAAAGDHDDRCARRRERMPHRLARLGVGLARDRARVHDHDPRLVLIDDPRSPAEELGGDRLALDAVHLAAERAKRDAARMRGATDVGRLTRSVDPSPPQRSLEPPIPRAQRCRATHDAAVSVRRTVGPSDATVAPSSRQRLDLLGAQPALGADHERDARAVRRHADRRAPRRCPGRDAPPTARPPGRSRRAARAHPRRPADRARSAPRDRLACSAADFAMRRQRSPRLARFAASSLTTEREVTTPMISSAPTSTACRTMSSIFSPLATPWNERHARQALARGRRSDRATRGHDTGVARRDHLDARTRRRPARRPRRCSPARTRSTAHGVVQVGRGRAAAAGRVPPAADR